MKMMNARLLGVATVSALALLAGSLGGEDGRFGTGLTGAAFAQDDGDHEGETGQSGQGYMGGQGEGEKGSQSGQGNQGGEGAGQGGPSSDSDGKGPQAGGPSDSSGGGKPVWAQEGIPEVELGRLSVARSPDQVLDRALAEALTTFVPEMEAFYTLSFDAMVEELSLNWDSVTLYDSPLQNLALMQDVLADGATQLPVSNSTDTLLAVFLGVASDKTIEITTDTVTAVTTILGYPITGQAAAALADDAEAIRIAVLAGHG